MLILISTGERPSDADQEGTRACCQAGCWDAEVRLLQLQMMLGCVNTNTHKHLCTFSLCDFLLQLALTDGGREL